MKWLSWMHRLPRFFIGGEWAFVYWDKPMCVLEFYLLDHVKYYYIPPQGGNE